MISVSVADLTKDVGKYLSDVKGGETIEVREDGKPVAIVSPARQAAKEYWRNLKPLPIRLRGGLSLTKALLAEREEGR